MFEPSSSPQSGSIAVSKPFEPGSEILFFRLEDWCSCTRPGPGYRPWGVRDVAPGLEMLFVLIERHPSRSETPARAAGVYV
jgi:hypothetical protein